MISERISDDISPQMKNLNTVIPMHSNALLTFSLQKDSEMYFVVPIRPAAASCIKPFASCIYLGDNHIQNFHLGRYIRRYTSPNEKFEYGYPHSNAL